MMVLKFLKKMKLRGYGDIWLQTKCIKTFKLADPILIATFKLQKKR